MTAFWIFAVLLALLTAAAVALPLWRGPRSEGQDLLALNRRVFRERIAELEKDQAEGRIDAETLAELRTELERNLLTLQPETTAAAPRAPLRRTAAVTLVLLPLLALGLYFAVLAPQGLRDWWTLKAEMGPVVDRMLQDQRPTEAEVADRTLADMIRVLQDRLQQEPGNAKAWFQLGSSYMDMRMLEPAHTAFEHAWQLEPGNPLYALALVQTRLFGNEGQLDPLSRQLLEGVLAETPDHEGALVLLGFGAYRSGDHATAVTALQHLFNLRDAQARSAGTGAEADSMSAHLRSVLADARAHLADAKSGKVAAARSGILVKLRVDPALAGKYAPGDTVFIFARAIDGTPMPLAAVRRSAAELPLTVVLDDSLAVMGRSLSSVQQVLVSARISRQGTPEAQAGDLEAVPVPVRQNGKVQTVELVIRNER
jgi:cytochrome c-type biogenesis protein CcmH